MDQLFTDLLGKPSSKLPKIITVVADNFSLLEDQARFLKATFFIPEVKKLGPRKFTTLLQIGHLPIEIEEQLLKENWTILKFDQFGTTLYDQIEKSLEAGWQLFYINDASRLELSTNDPKEVKKLSALIYKIREHFHKSVVVLYQNSVPNNQSKLLRNLLYISDGVSRVQSCKTGYFTSIWYEKDKLKSNMLLPMKVETHYYTCKIGKFYWSNDLLCFYENKQVPKNYDLENDTYLDAPLEESDQDNQECSIDELNDSLRTSRLDDYEKERESTKPYTAAQDPQKSRIFYFPDKEDDIDEDDPDNDLMI